MANEMKSSERSGLSYSLLANRSHKESNEFPFESIANENVLLSQRTDIFLDIKSNEMLYRIFPFPNHKLFGKKSTSFRKEAFVF